MSKVSVLDMAYFENNTTLIKVDRFTTNVCYDFECGSLNIYTSFKKKIFIYMKRVYAEQYICYFLCQLIHYYCYNVNEFNNKIACRIYRIRKFLLPIKG